MKPGRKQATVMMNSRTYDILSYIKIQRGAHNVMDVIDRLFSVNEANRTEAWTWLKGFLENKVETARFNHETQSWELDLDMTNPEFPVQDK